LNSLADLPGGVGLFPRRKTELRSNGSGILRGLDNLADSTTLFVHRAGNLLRETSHEKFTDHGIGMPSGKT
jgi:hypothetical protein